MLLTMRKGQEHRPVITKRLDDPNDFMYSAYQQALAALLEIIQQAKNFSQPEEKDYTEKLYGYVHNIIAFSGSRGQGKTSAMLSFSEALRTCDMENQGAFLSPLKDCSFTVLPPFDPTILEENQSILAVILSRMYRRAEDAWHKQSSNFLLHQEAKKNDLLELFQKCLSGINAIKFRKGDEIKTLHAIHEISDSSLLKENFWRLTDCLLHIVSEKPSRYSFLVVQLDDTDFQIRKGYEILEDIRKYLTLPNVIILMATDLDMLRNSLVQHYINEFKPGLDQKLLEVSDLRKLESKYLDKLIPPTFTVYLPHLDDMIQQQSNFIKLTYISPEDEEKPVREHDIPKNLLLPDDHDRMYHTEDFSLQSMILRFIYRKTRIVFAEHTTYLHDLIPTTLRGLAQFLGLLASMDDVPEINANDPRLDEPHKLAELVLEQVRILEVNLYLFENYFLHDWVHTKLPKEKAAIIISLANTLPEHRCQLVLNFLEKNLQADGTDTSQKTSYIPYNYTNMVQRLLKWKEQNRQMEDFYLVFAIQTFFTVQFHKVVARQKRCAAQSFLAEEKNKDQLLLFDFSPESTNLPTQFYIPEFPKETEGYKIVTDVEKKDYVRLQTSIKNSYACQLLLPESQEGQHFFSPMNFIGLFLSLGSPEGKRLAEGTQSQRDLYLAQTSAATIAINWDVQERLQKLSKFPDRDQAHSYHDALKSVLDSIDNTVQSLNPCLQPENSCPMVTSYLKHMINIIIGEKIQSDLRAALRMIEWHLGANPLEQICDIYELTLQLQDFVLQFSSNGNDSKKIEELINRLANITEKKGAHSPDDVVPFDLATLIEKTYAYVGSGTKSKKISKAQFVKTIDRLLKGLYEQYGYSEDEIKAEIKRKKQP